MADNKRRADDLDLEDREQHKRSEAEHSRDEGVAEFATEYYRDKYLRERDEVCGKFEELKFHYFKMQKDFDDISAEVKVYRNTTKGPLSESAKQLRKAQGKNTDLTKDLTLAQGALEKSKLRIKELEQRDLDLDLVKDVEKLNAEKTKVAAAKEAVKERERILKIQHARFEAKKTQIDPANAENMKKWAATLVAKNNKILELEREKAEAIRLRDETTEELQTLDTEMKEASDQHEAETEAIYQKLDKARRDMKKLKSDKKTLETQLQELQKAAVSAPTPMEGVIEGPLAVSGTLDQALEDVREEIRQEEIIPQISIEALQDNLAKARKEKSELEASTQGLQEELAAARKYMSNLEASTKRFQDNLATARNEKSDLETSTERLEDELVAARKEKSGLEASTKRLQHKLTKARKENSDLENSIKALQALQRQCKEAVDAKTTLETSNEKLQSHLDQAILDIASREKQLRKHNEKVDELAKRKARSSKQATRKLTSKVEQEEESKDKLKADIDSEINLKEEAQQAKYKLHKQAERTAAYIKTLTKDLDNLKIIAANPIRQSLSSPEQTALLQQSSNAIDIAKSKIHSQEKIISTLRARLRVAAHSNAKIYSHAAETEELDRKEDEILELKRELVETKEKTLKAGERVAIELHRLQAFRELVEPMKKELARKDATIQAFEKRCEDLKMANFNVVTEVLGNPNQEVPQVPISNPRPKSRKQEKQEFEKERGSMIRLAMATLLDIHANTEHELPHGMPRDNYKGQLSLKSAAPDGYSCPKISESFFSWNFSSHSELEALSLFQELTFSFQEEDQDAAVPQKYFGLQNMMVIAFVLILLFGAIANHLAGGWLSITANVITHNLVKNNLDNVCTPDLPWIHEKIVGLGVVLPPVGVAVEVCGLCGANATWILPF